MNDAVAMTFPNCKRWAHAECAWVSFMLGSDRQTIIRLHSLTAAYDTDVVDEQRVTHPNPAVG